MNVAVVPSKIGARRVRVILVSCSGLLGGLIREALSTAPEVRVVRDLPDGGSRRLLRAVRWFRPDVVVWRLDDDRVLTERPEYFGSRHQCSVLAVLGDGERGSVWRLRPQRSPLGPLSPSTLAAAVRAAAVRS